jgi:hypothetical protein
MFLTDVACQAPPRAVAIPQHSKLPRYSAQRIRTGSLRFPDDRQDICRVAVSLCLFELADDMPNYSGHSGKFMLKLMAAWIAMGFRRPEINLGKTVQRAQ